MRPSTRTLRAIPLRWRWLALLLALAVTGLHGRDVPYDPTPAPIVRAMLALANVHPGDLVYDLGSGDGRIVIAAARDFGARAVGIEIDPRLIARARAHARAAGVEDRVRFEQGDLYAADLRPATVVTLFLLQDVNLKLRPKLLAELSPGTRVVSQIWTLGDDWPPEAAQRVEGRMIYLWRIPGRTGTASMTPTARRAPRGDVARPGSRFALRAAQVPVGSCRRAGVW